MFIPLGKSYFTVKIDNVDITSSLNLNLDSLRWRYVLNAPSDTEFILGIPYDSGDKPSLDETVEILFNDNRKFYGYITSITKSVEPEGISIHAEGEYYKINDDVENFYIGRKSDESITETYYTTYKQALSALGADFDIGDFVPLNESFINVNKANAISNIVSNCGTFAWYILPNGTKKLWKGDKGSIITLEKQSLDTNLGLFQVINHNITEEKDITTKADKIKVIMGDDIKVGYDSSSRDVRLYIDFQIKPAEDENIYSRNYKETIGWRDTRENQTDEDSIELVYDGWRIVVPAGFNAGFPLTEKSPGVIAYANHNTADENIKGIGQAYFFLNKGGIYPEGRKEHIFYVGTGDNIKTLDLSHLNRQLGVNYEKITDIFPYSFQSTSQLNSPISIFDGNAGVPFVTFKKVNTIIPSWDDTAYATDIANWELEKHKDNKIVGSLNVTIDCAEFYGLELNRRIECSGIIDSPVNIKSIEYDVGNYLVTINVESENYFKRTVSIPIHEKVRTV
ncbi:hypothetical protein LCGC14_1166410 [marine sediment metagenome]|uniref:Uncharacterized protein n=1 Tax=marine sediment metagenome TaxID=412755 RepID=A0A0F9LR83_9ZZZZ